MKRSEMLSIICDIIHQHRRATEGVTSEELSEWVLESIEESGMAPPLFDSRTFGKSPEHKWEDEDDSQNKS